MFVALFTQDVNLISMCRIILQTAACCAALTFVTLSYKRHEFWRRHFAYKNCVQLFCTSFFWNISHPEKNLARYYHNSKQIFMKITCFLLRILSHLNLWTDFGSLVIWNFIKIRPLWPQFFQADRRTDCRTDTPNEANSRSTLSCECH